MPSSTFSGVPSNGSAAVSLEDDSGALEKYVDGGRKQKVKFYK